jgi:hypothetical protein
VPLEQEATFRFIHPSITVFESAMLGFTKKVTLFSLALMVLIWRSAHLIYKPQQYENKSNVHWCSELHFIKKSSSEDENLVTGLASFPGSGNTWIRHILQQATGIYTASVYKETLSLTNGIPLQMINSSALVVKTHKYGRSEYRLFDKAVLLIRDPLKSILAEYNRQNVGKTGSLTEEAFTGTSYRRRKC